MTNNSYVPYEYKEIPAGTEGTAFLLDCYESLGWELDARLGTKQGYLTLRRSRKRANFMELTRLQGYLEACLAQMEQLEKRKSAKATSAALAVGVGGTVLMTLSVFAVTAQPPRLLWCVLFGIPALTLWTWAPLLYRKLYRKHSLAAAELLEKKREEIFEICEKGSKLL